MSRTISGAIMGAFFFTLLPRSRRTACRAAIRQHHRDRGGLTVFQVESILYGLLIIGFLIFEPRGLFGIWIRVRNYWKSWPFSY